MLYIKCLYRFMCTGTFICVQGFDYNGVREIFLSVEGIRQIHNLRYPFSLQAYLVLKIEIGTINVIVNVIVCEMDQY